jgi:daunorubicin resistance ABC transporter membrane protein
MELLSRNDGGMIAVLWWRDTLLFFRHKARIAGALAPPLLLWAAIGAGIAPSFRIEGAGVGYLEYFYPGVLVVVLLQISVTATMSVIEDRRQGFLQGVLVAPGSRTALVIGKSIGSATVGVFHAAIFLALAPAAGFALASIDWVALAAMLVLLTLALSSAGLALAWWLDSVQAYHVVMGVVLFPLWMISGAFFPTAGQSRLLQVAVTCNPMTYALSGVRRALYGGELPHGLVLTGSGALLEFSVVAAVAVTFVVLASWVCSRRTG